MKNYLEIGEEDCAGTQRAAQPLVSPGILSALHLVNVHELQDLRSALAKGFVPPDLEAKLAKLAKESLLHQFVDQNCRLFIALLAAAEQRSFTEANPAATERLLGSRALGLRVRPLVSLSVDMTDVYPAAHWARTGRAPGYHTPDEDVYLPGRNIVLLGKAGVFCAAAGIGRAIVEEMRRRSPAQASISSAPQVPRAAIQIRSRLTQPERRKATPTHS